MRIDHCDRKFFPDLQSISKAADHVDSPNLTTVSSSGFEHYTVELTSVTPRELPEGAIVHHPAKRVFNEEIQSSLDHALAGKAPEVGEAVYRLIDSNFFAESSEYSEEERNALIAAGLTQARFIADNYMQPEEAEAFMDTMRLLAAVAKTRTADPETGRASYVQLPQRPQGAPEDYVNTRELMEKHDPEAHAKLRQAIAEGGNFAGILISFLKKLRDHPEWIQEYRREQANLMNRLRNTRIDNEFGQVRASSVQDFAEAMIRQIGQSSVANKELLIRNTMAFAKTLGIDEKEFPRT